MDIILPADCGNPPRRFLVGEFAVNWAACNDAEVKSRLADDATWRLVGAPDHGARADAGAQEERIPRTPLEPDRIEILSTVTHGWLAEIRTFLHRR